MVVTNVIWLLNLTPDCSMLWWEFLKFFMSWFVFFAWFIFAFCCKSRDFVSHYCDFSFLIIFPHFISLPCLPHPHPHPHPVLYSGLTAPVLGRSHILSSKSVGLSFVLLVYWSTCILSEYPFQLHSWSTNWFV